MKTMKLIITKMRLMKKKKIIRMIMKQIENQQKTQIILY